MPTPIADPILPIIPPNSGSIKHGIYVDSTPEWGHSLVADRGGLEDAIIFQAKSRLNKSWIKSGDRSMERNQNAWI
jgi:hypothetical protein